MIYVVTVHCTGMETDNYSGFFSPLGEGLVTLCIRILRITRQEKVPQRN
jgi:hypothetical protein